MFYNAITMSRFNLVLFVPRLSLLKELINCFTCHEVPSQVLPTHWNGGHTH